MNRCRSGPLAYAAAVVLLLACTSGAQPPKEVVLAVDTCSAVGATGNLGACLTEIDHARLFCTGLGGSRATSCGIYLDQLRVAALEAHHLRTGECNALTSEQARSLCLTASPQPEASPSAPVAEPTQPPAPAVVPPAPQQQPDRDENGGPGNGGENRRNKEDKKSPKD